MSGTHARARGRRARGWLLALGGLCAWAAAAYPAVAAVPPVCQLAPVGAPPTRVVDSSTPSGTQPGAALRERCPLCGDGDLPRALLALGSSNPRERVRAVRALAASRSPLVSAPIEALASSDPAPAVRAECVRALGRRIDLRHLTVLLGASHDAFGSVRRAAAEALGRYSVARSRERLAALLADADELRAVRREALEALQAHQTREAHAAIVRIAAELPASDPLHAPVARAARSAAPCGACREPVRLLTLADAYHPRIARRSEAMEAITGLDLPIAAKLSLLRLGTADEEAVVRTAAATSAVGLAKDDAAALPLLAELATTSEYPSVRSAASEALRKDNRVAASRALAPLVAVRRPAVAVRAVNILLVRYDKAATRGLVAAVGVPNATVALEALQSVVAREPTAATLHEALDRGLRHPDREVVHGALELLKDGRGDEHVSALVQALERDDLSATDQKLALELVSHNHAEPVTRAVVAKAQHGPRGVREAALRALAGRQDPAARRALLGLSRSDDEALAAQAAAAALHSNADLAPEQLLAVVGTHDSDAAIAALRNAARQLPAGPRDRLVAVLEAGLVHQDPTVADAAASLLLDSEEVGSQQKRALLLAAIAVAPSTAGAETVYRRLAAGMTDGLDEAQRALLQDGAVAPATVRQHALEAVVSRRPADRRDLLERHRRDAHFAVRLAARRLLARLEVGALGGASPDERPQVGGGPLPFDSEAVPLLRADQPWNGRWPLTFAMAGLGATAFGTVAALAETSPGGRFSAYVLGGVLGGATPFLLTLNRDVTLGQSLYITSHTTWGAFAAWQGAQLLSLQEQTGLEGIDRGLGILAGMGAVGLSTWKVRDADWTGADAFFANFTALQVGLATKSLHTLLADDATAAADRRGNGLAVVAAWGAGLLPATLVNERLHFSGADLRLLGLSASMGAWLGGWAGLGLGDPDDHGVERMAGLGVLGGQALGYLAGVVLGHHTEIAPGTPRRLALSAGLGAGMGLGAALFGGPLSVAELDAERDVRLLSPWVGAGTVAGLAAGVALPHLFDLQPAKRPMVMLSTLYGAVAGGLLPFVDEAYANGAVAKRRHAGGALLGGSLALLTSMGIAPIVEPTALELKVGAGVTAVMTTAAVGVGLWSCTFTDDPRGCPTRVRLARFGQTGAAAGVLTAALLSDRLPASSSAVGNGAAAGAWGALNGYLLTRMLPDAVRTGHVGGAMTLASVAGSAVYLSADALGLRPYDGAALLGASLGGNAWGAGLGHLIPRSSHRMRLGLALAAPFGLAALGGATSLLYERPPEVTVRRLGLGAALGAWYGGLVPSLWEPDAPRRDERRAGGAATGALSGAALALATAPLLREDDLIEVALYSTAGNLLGAGLALQRDDDVLPPLAWVGLGSLVAGALVAPWTHYERADASWLLSGVVVGAWHGRILAGGPTNRATGGALVGGVAGGVAVAAATQWTHPRKPTDAGEMLLATLAGDGLGLGLALLADDEPEPWVAGAGLGLAVLSSAWAPHTQYDRKDVYWITTLGGLGAWHGSLLGGLPGPGADVRLSQGGALLGGAVGVLGAGAVSQWYRPDVADASEAVFFAGLGNAMGLGLGLMVEPGSRSLQARLAQGVGLAGALAGTVLSPWTRYDFDDAPLLATTTLLSGVTGFFLPRAAGPREEEGNSDVYRARGGGVLFGVGLGLAAGAGLSQQLRLSWGEAAEVGFSYGAGSAVGFGLGGLIRPDDVVLYSRLQLVGGMVGALASTLWMEHTTYSRTDLAMGALVASIGAWHGRLWTRDFAIEELEEGLPWGRERFASALASGLGLFGAMGLANFLEYEAADVVEIGSGAVLGNVLGAGITFLQRAGRQGERSLHAQNIAGLSLAAASAVLAPAVRFDRDDAPLLSLGAVAGAGLGVWLPSMWAAEPSADERLGGTLALGGLGVLATTAASQWVELKPAEATAAAGGLGMLALVGDGVGLLLLPNGSPQARHRLAAGSAVLLGAGLGLGASPLGLQRARLDVAAVGGLIGGLQGLWIPRLLGAWGERGPGRARVAGLQVGVPVGMLAATVTSAHASYTSADWAEALTGAVLGQIAGYAGVCLFGGARCHSGIARGDGEGQAAWGAEVAGLGVMGLALLASPATRYDRGDTYLALGTAGVLGAYGRALAGELRDGRTGEGMALGGALGLLAGASASQRLHLSPPDVAEVLCGTAMAHLFAGELMWLFDHGRAVSDARRRRVVAQSAAGLGALVLSSVTSSATSYEGTDWGLMTLSAGVGAAAGVSLGSLADSGGTTPETRQHAGAMGGLVGTLAGMLAAQHVSADPASLWFGAGGAVVGNVLGWAFGQLGGPTEREAMTAVGMSVGGVGLSLGAGLFADRLQVSSSNAGMLGLIGVMGAWHGTWLSRAWTQGELDQADGRQLFGGGMLGAGVGLLTGAAFASRLEYRPPDIAESAMGWVAANSLGAGVGLLLKDPDSTDYRLPAALMEAAGITGALAVARYAPQTRYSIEDWVLGTLATGHGVWQGIGMSRLLEQEDDEKLAGGIMVTTAVGGLAGSWISQRLQLSLADTLAGFSGTLWGAWIGAWAGIVYKKQLSVDVTGVSALGSDVGLLLSSLAVSRIGRMPPARVGYINLFGVVGALAGAAVGVFLPGSRNVETGTLYGTAVTLALGTWLSGSLGLGTDEGIRSAGESVSGGFAFGRWWARQAQWLPQITVAVPMVGPILPPPGEVPVARDGMQIGLQGQWK